MVALGKRMRSHGSRPRLGRSFMHLLNIYSQLIRYAVQGKMCWEVHSPESNYSSVPGLDSKSHEAGALPTDSLISRQHKAAAGRHLLNERIKEQKHLCCDGKNTGSLGFWNPRI